MRINPFGRRRRPTRPTVEIVDLDFYRPLEFALEPPVRTEVMAALEHEINRLLPNAADGGNGDVLDGLIESKLAQWRAALESEHTARLAALQHLTECARTALAAAREHAAATQHAYHEAYAEYEALKLSRHLTPQDPTPQVPGSRKEQSNDHATPPPR